MYVIPALVDRRPESSSTFFPLLKFPNFFFFFFWFRLSSYTFCISCFVLFWILYYYSTSNFFRNGFLLKSGPAPLPPMTESLNSPLIIQLLLRSQHASDERDMKEEVYANFPESCRIFPRGDWRSFFCYFLLLLLSVHFFIFISSSLKFVFYLDFVIPPVLPSISIYPFRRFLWFIVSVSYYWANFFISLSLSSNRLDWTFLSFLSTCIAPFQL